MKPLPARVTNERLAEVLRDYLIDENAPVVKSYDHYLSRLNAEEAYRKRVIAAMHRHNRLA